MAQYITSFVLIRHTDEDGTIPHALGSWFIECEPDDLEAQVQKHIDTVIGEEPDVIYRLTTQTTKVSVAKDKTVEFQSLGHVTHIPA